MALNRKVEGKEREKINHWTDMWFGPSKRYGFVEISNLGKNYRKFYGADDVEKMLEETGEVPERYISLNGFPRKTRKEIDVLQLRNIGIDVDFYTVDEDGNEIAEEDTVTEPMQMKQALDEIQALVLAKDIPEPNLVLKSRGIQLLYSLNGGASKKIGWKYKYIQKQLTERLSCVGADPGMKTITAVMRFPGSINKRNGSKVTWEVWNNQKYELEELEKFCDPIKEQSDFNGKKEEDVGEKVIQLTDEDEYKELTGMYKLNHERMMDLEKLIELRKGNMSYRRNTFIYMYSFHFAIYNRNKDDLKKHLKDVRNRIHSIDKDKFSDDEFNRTLDSAYEDAQRFVEQYRADGYKIVFRWKDGIIKPYSSGKLIEILKITDEEVEVLKSVTKVPKGERNEKRKLELREERGSVPREEYLAGTTEKTRKSIEEVEWVLEKYPGISNRKAGEKIGKSEAHVRKIKKKIGRYKDLRTGCL